MKNTNTRGIITLLAVLMLCFLLSGCQSKNVKYFNDQLMRLQREEITLESWPEIHQVVELELALTQKERDSLQDSIGTLDSIVAEYKALEDAAVKNIEDMIPTLPALEDIRLNSENVINAVYWAYSNSTEEVKNRVSGAETILAVKAGYEEYKRGCWAACTACGGDGIEPCSICHGTGSKKAKYTTPNGKTWDVTQDCPKTQTCDKCGGSGGSYVEKKRN